MITGIIGRRGNGKTLLMVRRLYRRWKMGYRIITNFWVDFPHETLDAARLVEMGDDLKNCAIGIDEFHVLADSRNSGRERNKMISYFILQTRKRNVVLYYTTQHEMQVDVRVRRSTDYWVRCKRVAKHLFRYRVFDGLSGKLCSLFTVDGRSAYSLYDTTQAITDFEPPRLGTSA